jgi:hypothetical protein
MLSPPPSAQSPLRPTQVKPAGWLFWLAVALLAAISIIPLIGPHIPPLTDLPGHLGRYAVQTGLASDPILARWYSFDWALMGNLGVDLLVQMFAPLIGVEAATKAIVIAIVILTVAGFLAVARVATGRIGPAALFALPLAYGFPFQFGFVNYCLSMALAFLAFALWMRLGASGRIGYRAALFVPLSFLIWLAHIGGWGALGLFALAAEVVRLRGQDRGQDRGLIRAWVEAGLHCLPLALPALVTLAVRAQGAAGDTGIWFHWLTKYQWFTMSLSDRWQGYDFLCAVGLVFVILVSAILSGLRFNRTLGLAALLLFVAYLLMPRVLIGSAYADMRLAPFILAMALLAIEPAKGSGKALPAVLMTLGLGFFLMRTATTTESFARYDRMMTAELRALDLIPRHTRIVALVGRKCYAEWQLERRTHLPSLAIVRRHAFTNDQFVMPGAQLLGVRYAAAVPFTIDPSQMVTDDDCVRPDWLTYTKSVALIPRDAFDYLWVLGAPMKSKPDLRGFTQVWQEGRSTLYRIEQIP